MPQNPEAEQLAINLGQFGHSPITGIHLWFDREITDLEHAILLDATIQWLFHKSRLQAEKRRGAPGSYVELVVSASNSLVEMQRQEIIDLALRELAEFFPLVVQAKLVKAAVVKEVRATYSIRPQLDLLRPTAGESVAARLSGGRLDSHRLAGNDGGRCPQRLPGGRSCEPCCWRASEFPASRPAGHRLDAAVLTKKRRVECRNPGRRFPCPREACHQQ